MIKIVLKSFLVRERVNREQIFLGGTRPPKTPLWGNPSRSPQTPYPYRQSWAGLQIMTGKIRLSLLHACRRMFVHAAYVHVLSYVPPRVLVKCQSNFSRLMHVACWARTSYQLNINQLRRNAYLAS